MDTLSAQARAGYYAGALLLLSFLESRRSTGRRFGPEADARWSGFAGHLGACDRLDLLVRDADLEWPGAIGARRVFGLAGVADDDAFGPTWEGIAHPLALELFRTHGGLELASLEAWLDRAFTVARRPRAAIDVPAIAPNDRFVVTGANAVASLLAVFEARRELDFGAQVLVASEDPFARQLAAAAPLVLATGSPAHLTGTEGDPSEALSAWRSASLLVSSDASDAERALATTLVSGPRSH
jgi:hypothetical protein